MSNSRRVARSVVGLLAGLAVLTLGDAASALDKVTFGTNWKAQAEHGGYYQAVADGTYAKHGLDVTVRQGGPQVNHSQLLAAGKIDFNMGGNVFGAFNYVQNDIPMVTVAAIFQKDPQILMAHPDQGFRTLADLKGRPILISQDARTTYWEWLKAEFGFTDDMIRPYTFNPAPFLADPGAIQQGYLTSEPFAVEREGGFVPQVFLLADAGYDTYSTTIETSWRLVEKNPDLVQLSVRRPGARQRADQGRQPGDDRRADRVLDRQAQGVRHRRFARGRTARHRRHDRRALAQLLPVRSRRRAVPEGPRPGARLHLAVRQQEGRHGAEGLSLRTLRHRRPFGGAPPPSRPGRGRTQALNRTAGAARCARRSSR
jgi:ABC-type nitrate/sulfonate/bicarbonate transport system substrate-binding protein